MEELRHSGMGIASFIISLVAGLLLFILIVIAGVVESSTPGGMDESSMTAVLIGLGMLALISTELVGAGLGIAGLLQKERKKIFALLGTIFSSFMILACVGLIVIGVAIG